MGAMSKSELEHNTLNHVSFLLPAYWEESDVGNTLFHVFTRDCSSSVQPFLLLILTLPPTSLNSCLCCGIFLMLPATLGSPYVKHLEGLMLIPAHDRVMHFLSLNYEILFLTRLSINGKIIW